MSALQHAFWDEGCARELSDEKLLAAMARFEGALAKACAAAGLVPAGAADTIAGVAEPLRQREHARRGRIEAKRDRAVDDVLARGAQVHVARRVG